MWWFCLQQEKDKKNSPYRLLRAESWLLCALASGYILCA